MRVWLAIKCFFKILFDAEFAHKVKQLGEGEPAQSRVVTAPAASAALIEPSAPKPQRSDAITLLATLQREARFVDIVSEPLDGYSDAQIGAASRDVLRDCGKVIERLFTLRPAVDSEEGARIEVPADYDAGVYRLTGSVSGEAPYSGELVHCGWRAAACELPAWTGGEQAALVIAPAEVQVS